MLIGMAVKMAKSKTAKKLAKAAAKQAAKQIKVTRTEDDIEIAVAGYKVTAREVVSKVRSRKDRTEVPAITSGYDFDDWRN